LLERIHDLRTTSTIPALLLFLFSLPSLPLNAGQEGGKNRRRESDRTPSIKALCERLKIGPGGVVADIGCGNGSDSFRFAAVVGKEGTVYAEEISEGKVKGVEKEAKKRELSQVVPILGKADDPNLPHGKADLIYMRLVFHHFSKPREMLRNMWLDLKPGGHLVIVDRARGPLRVWVSFESRQNRHNWTSDLAVVRMAREEGFLFKDILEDLWAEKDSFVLAFQRPLEGPRPAGDCDLPLPLDARKLVDAIPLPGSGKLNIALLALDRGRAILPALNEALGSRACIFDFVLEEWALTKEEVPPNPDGVKVETIRIEEGGFTVPGGVAFDAVLFIDAYHRLWNPLPVLACLHRNLAPGGFVVVVDRNAPEGEPRRLSNHRRRISSTLVRSELEQAGFEVSPGMGSPTPDRFGLIFRPRSKQRWVRGNPVPAGDLAWNRE